MKNDNKTKRKHANLYKLKRHFYSDAIGLQRRFFFLLVEKHDVQRIKKSKPVVKETILDVIAR